MLNRWFSASRASGADGGEQDDAPAGKADFIVLPPAASDSWRLWLMTGARRVPVDRRRMRGAHKGLKKMLIDGTASPDDRLQPWNDFSSAMVRQAVDEALNGLPPGQKQAVKLAYFGGMTNHEIAQQLGVGESAVRRRLRDALEAVNFRIQRGRVAGRRVVYAIAGWLAARSIIDRAQRSTSTATDHVMQAAAAVTVSVVAAAVLVANPASPPQHRQASGGFTHASPTEGAKPVPSAGVVPPSTAPAGSVEIPRVSGQTVAVPSAPVNVSVPVTIPVPVTTPVPVPTPVPVTIPPIKVPKLPKPAL